MSLGETSSNFDVTPDSFTTSLFLTGGSTNYSFILSKQALGQAGTLVRALGSFFLEVHSTKIKAHLVKINQSGVVSGKTISFSTPVNSATYGSTTQACIHPNGKSIYIIEQLASSTVVRKIHFDKSFFVGN